MKRVLLGIGLLLLAGASLFALSTVVGSRSALVVSPDHLEFGEVPAGESERRVVVVTNTSDEAITIQRIETPTPFGVAHGSLALGPRQSQALMVTFTPTQSGRSEGQLVLESSALGYGSRTVQLEGSAFRPAGIEVAPLFISFGEVGIGGKGRASISIANLGEADLEVGSLAAAKPFSAQVQSVTVASAETRSVEVYFEPSAAEDYASALTIRSNDPERTKILVYLDGSGAEHAPAPRIEVNPANLDFGEVRVGGRQTQRIAIRNRGEDPLTLAALQAPAHFAAPGRSRKIQPGGELFLPVSFSPAAEGSLRGALTIYSNDPQQRVVAVSLSGAGQEGAVADSRGGGDAPLRGSVVSSRPDARGELTVGSPPGGERGLITTAEAGIGPDGTVSSEAPAPNAAEQVPSSGLEDGLVRLASYSEKLSGVHADSVNYDSSSGSFAINGLQLPTVDAALGEYFEFDPTAAIGRFDGLGETQVSVPVRMYDFRGNPVDMTLTLTTGVSTAVADGTLIAMIGSPLGADGRFKLVGLAEFPNRSPFGGDVMRLSLDGYVR